MDSPTAASRGNGPLKKRQAGEQTAQIAAANRVSKTYRTVRQTNGPREAAIQAMPQDKERTTGARETTNHMCGLCSKVNLANEPCRTTANQTS